MCVMPNSQSTTHVCLLVGTRKIRGGYRWWYPQFYTLHFSSTTATRSPLIIHRSERFEVDIYLQLLIGLVYITPIMAIKYRTANIIIMSAIALSIFRVSIYAFQFPSRTLYKRWASSVAYGRTTFRHPPGDMSWRMTASSDDTASSPSIDASTETALQQYHNKNNLDDQVFSAISACGGLKVTVATIRNLLNEFMIQESPSLCCFVVCYGVFASRMY